MGVQGSQQGKLFYHNINLENRVRPDHPLRRISEVIDFNFVYHEVSDKYGANGNVSVPPPVVLKLMLLLVFYNVRSERELLATVPERLDWLWFLGYDLDSAIPDHSILSKARKRWGVEVFKSFFEQIVLQCVEAGLVDGSKIFMDSSLVDADASNNSVIDTHSLKHRLRKNYQELEARLEERNEGLDLSRSFKKANTRYISSTDPDAAIVRRGKPKLSYQVHRSVDGSHEVVTATETTPGDVNEAHMLETLLDSHRETTGEAATTVVADSKYGTVDNFLACHDLGVEAHIPNLGRAAAKRAAKRNAFSEDQFNYDSEKDVYLCPAGQTMKRKAIHQNHQRISYAAPRKACASCELRTKCTQSKKGRRVTRHFRQQDLDEMRRKSRSAKAKHDIKTRQHLMERSFARAKRYGYDRARWRGLWKVQIQELLTCAIQNIQILVSRVNTPKSCQMMAMEKPKPGILRAVFLINGETERLGALALLTRCLNRQFHQLFEPQAKQT